MPSTSPQDRRSPAAEISNAVVRLIAEHTGRGPTRARTYLQEDLVACVVQDTLTRGELNLVRGGHEAVVLDGRTAHRRTMREELVAVVEGVLGRKVLVLLSDTSVDPDMAVEVFVLEPKGDADGPAGAG